MELSPLEQVRCACMEVVRRARHIQIAHDKIASYATSFVQEKSLIPEHDADSHYLGHGSDTIAFFLILDTVNFGSGYFPHLQKRPGKSGYFTIASSLNDYFKTHGPLSPEELSRFSEQDCIKLFCQDTDNQPIIGLMRHFAKAFNDLGRYVSERFEGKYVNVLESAGSSAEQLVRILIEMPYFNDVEPYDGLMVPFYKRAQITAADLAIAFQDHGPGAFTDLEHLTIFADNLVPHVLRVDGILNYKEDLAMRIDKGELIPAFSPEEVEIRACAVTAVELLKKSLHESGHYLSSRELDYLLWNRGQKFYYKAKPRHRTRSIFY